MKVIHNKTYDLGSISIPAIIWYGYGENSKELVYDVLFKYFYEETNLEELRTEQRIDIDRWVKKIIEEDET